jgi:hypothetical protein
VQQRLLEKSQSREKGFGVKETGPLSKGRVSSRVQHEKLKRDILENNEPEKRRKEEIH